MQSTNLHIGERFLRELRNNPLNHSTKHYTYEYMSYTDAANHTITTSVSIRVTPLEDDLVSWSILWSGFVIASIIAAWQVYREQRLFKLRRAGVTNTVVIDRDDEADTVDTTVGDGESVSSADMTRHLFRKLLLLAMICRVTLIPVQIWSDPMWWQFVSDTLPEMVFASAWTVLVTFFVQLVGIATGTGTNTSPGFVISATAYFIYLILITLQLVNKIASVLLYALMCCIYATLFGVVVYFCPRLIGLMRPSLVSHKDLALRLFIATAVCILIFGVHCIYYARLVIDPPRKVYWWFQYGALELIPAFAFLYIMHPRLAKGNRSYSPDISRLNHPSSGTFHRVDSNSRPNESDSLFSIGSGHIRRDNPQHKNGTGYGTNEAHNM